jgi:F-type H+-transporting ATPase subunit a
MRLRTKIALAIAGWIGLGVVLFLIFGSAGRNSQFQPQNEFKLEPWIPIKLGPVDLSITKGVLYLLLTAVLTVVTMIWIARRMAARPNRVQTAIESIYSLMRDNITQGNMQREMAARWFTFVGALFLFIWFANLIGYLPLPVNTEETVNVFGLELPTFAIYAATANLSIPLMLTLVVWFSYHAEGIRAKGFRTYFREFVPAGTPRVMKPLLFVIELISHFVRIISLSVRLFANLLAGHLLILFMGGGMVVLLGLAAIGVFTLPVAIAFYVFEVVLIATLQAFIFATLTAIYLGSATEAGH